MPALKTAPLDRAAETDLIARAIRRDEAAIRAIIALHNRRLFRGAFLIGAAGFLKGRRAATHWAYVDLLPLVGATHQKGRIVRDGNVFTSGGVSAGIDFAFRIVAELAGPEVAQAIQLGIEYDPAPPFDSGHPDKASTAAIELMVQRNEKAHIGVQQGLEKLATLAKVETPGD